MKKVCKIAVFILLIFLAIIFVFNIFQEFTIIKVRRAEITAYNSNIKNFVYGDYKETIQLYHNLLKSAKKEIFCNIMNVSNYCIFLVLIIIVELMLLPIERIKASIISRIKSRKQRKKNCKNN